LLIKNTRYKILEIFSIATNITILFAIFFKPEIIYNSYIGYNNIVAGGRFYGINNEAMGVLLVTSIISYFAFKNRIKNKLVVILALIIYFLIIITALSSGFGANMGGYLTSIAIFLMMLYVVLFNKRMNIKNFLLLLGIGVAIFFINIYIDLNSTSISHTGSLINRINILGFSELYEMIMKKAKQLLLMIIVPPWSIIFGCQIYFVMRFYRERRIFIEERRLIEPDVVKKIFIIFATSVVALVINDTGVIAFVYINTYLITLLTGLHNIK